MAKRPTVYDVAERAGVSIATVSFTFSQPHRVKESTRHSVEQAARELGYLPSASARGLARGRTGAIGLFSFAYFDRSAGLRPNAQTPFSDETNADFRMFPLYHDEVQRGVEMECWRRGYVLMVGDAKAAGGETDLADIAGRVDGLAVFPHTLPEDVLLRISKRIPVVELSIPVKDNGLHGVSVDNAGGMAAMTEHLITGHGYKDIVFVGPEGFPDKEQRFLGYSHAMAAAGLARRTLPTAPRGSLASFAAETVGALLSEGTLPEALLCSTDEEALAYMDALASAGVNVPQRIAVTGFDGLVAGLVNRPALTTVRQPMVMLGQTGASLLIDEVTKPSPDPVTKQLPVKLLIRESCGCTAG
ncbi:LacI family DNA-binding transcriptional regulator [Arthrobacter sp. CJ23]|uniref:LacI family DNA-binding transcriptional regulator n=1 Tax=Arthrobacter sp. CJ23 TaxID=2972479 RepID=UPI00215C7632|nr:LacI family DNA-binding transcriptional regulator [Arthrobacter sp. CJ23]UVJ40158.1 LacI family transcriptional regulator [Arthrobacter sp. CJ23]